MDLLWSFKLCRAIVDEVRQILLRFGQNKYIKNIAVSFDSIFNQTWLAVLEFAYWETGIIFVLYFNLKNIIIFKVHYLI